MQLQQWITELNAASTEAELVAVVEAYVAHARRSTGIPEPCLPSNTASLPEIRKAASDLTGLRVSSCGSNNADRDAYQAMMIFFSLAVDRIALLEARGFIPVEEGRASSLPFTPFLPQQRFSAN